MKKGAFLIIIISIISLVSVVLYQFNSLKLDNNKNTIVKNSESNIPLFEFTTLKGDIFSKYDLDKNRSTIIIYFDPDCGLCKKSAKIFYRFQKAHKDSQVLFVSSSTTLQIESFIKKFKLNEVININFYTVEFDTFYKLFNETNTPTYIIYNTKGEHIKTINEEVPVKILLRYIKAAQANE
jgi:peroxiredoxin